MVRKRVRSSNVSAIGYDPEQAVLEVQFLDGSVYQYYDVEEEVHQEFMTAPSKGRFLWQFIRDVYEYEQIA